MKINPKIKKINAIFYNNILLICVSFAILCFSSCIASLTDVEHIANGRAIQNGQELGPLKIDKNPKIYQLEAYYSGNNSSLDFSAEVLDADKDTLYEVGKDLWHESGYDSEGYWSESDRKMVARLNFYNPGTYYIRIQNPNNSQNLEVVVKKVKSSYVPYYILGFWLLFLSIFFGCINNKEALKTALVRMNESMEDA